MVVEERLRERAGRCIDSERARERTGMPAWLRASSACVQYGQPPDTNTTNAFSARMESTDDMEEGSVQILDVNQNLLEAVLKSEVSHGGGAQRTPTPPRGAPKGRRRVR